MKKYNRREFVKVACISGSGLFLAAFVPAQKFLKKAGEEPKIFSPSVYLKIDSNGIVTIIVHRSEMGQGVLTSLPMLVAEELECDWKKIRVEQADADPKYGNQTTGGSWSIRRSFDPFRIAGATAREMLISAAAIKWNVKPENCRAENSFVINKLNGKKLSYGELVEEASKLPVPKNIKLKDPKDYKIIGKKIHRLETPDKVYGIAKFGIDILIPNMVYASVERPPAFDSKVKSFNANKTRTINGVIDVVEIPQGVAVIANSTWISFKGRESLTINWDLGPHAKEDSKSIHDKMAHHLNEEGEEIELRGNPDFDISSNLTTIEGIYELPFLAHATLEPMNCVADVKDGKAELWVPTQNPQGARSDVAKALGCRRCKGFGLQCR